MMDKRTWVVVAAALTAAGCSSAPPSHGVVLDKHYIPGETTYIMLKGVAIPDTGSPCYELVVRKPDHTVANDCVSETDYYNTAVRANY